MTGVALRVIHGQGASMDTHNDVTALPDYETWLRSWGAAESTIKVRLSVLSRALVGTDGTTQGLAAWLAQFDAPWTKSTYYSHLSSFYGWLHETGRRADDPTRGLRRPRTGTSRPRPLSEDEAVAVLGAAEGRVRAYVMLGMYAGLRAHEVAKIAGEDINAETLYVLGKGRQVALIPTHPALWELAQEHPRHGLWFPSPRRDKAGQSVTPTAVSLAVTKLFYQLGIEGSLHRCRHTYGTRLLRSGANIRVVQTLMRHSNLATTAKYTAVDEVEQIEAIRRLAA